MIFHFIQYFYMATKFSKVIMPRCRHKPKLKSVACLFFIKSCSSQDWGTYKVRDILDFDLVTQFWIMTFITPRYSHIQNGIEFIAYCSSYPAQDMHGRTTPPFLLKQKSVPIPSALQHCIFLLFSFLISSTSYNFLQPSHVYLFY